MQPRPRPSGTAPDSWLRRTILIMAGTAAAEVQALPADYGVSHGMNPPGDVWDIAAMARLFPPRSKILAEESISPRPTRPGAVRWLRGLLWRQATISARSPGKRESVLPSLPSKSVAPGRQSAGPGFRQLAEALGKPPLRAPAALFRCTGEVPMHFPRD